jgi:hypothetical protein
MQNNFELMMERSPEIGFFLNHYPFDSLSEELILHLDDPSQMEKWDTSLDLEGIDTLYVFGLGLGYAYDLLKEWLDAKRGRCLIFLEENLGNIEAFLKGQETSRVLLDSRVHFRCVLEEQMWDEMIEDLAQEFVSDKVACTVLPTYQEKRGEWFKKIELKLLRATAAIHALFCESLHSQKIFANLYPNFQKLPHVFFANKLEGKFAKVPAIICGAGPSLKTAIPILKDLENKALIIAGGSSITALTSQGIEPHLGIALDPNFEEYKRLKPSQAFEMPLLYANRVHPDIFATCNGPCGYLRSDTGGIAEGWLEEKLGITGEAIGPDLGREAFSVTTLAVALAYSMGCDPIIFVGVDLAYTGMQRYAGGVLDVANDLSFDKMKEDKRVMERLLEREDRNGNTVYTTLKWVMESSCIGAYALAHPERTFLNATDGGIGFPHISYLSLEEIKDRYCYRSFNLRGKIHSEVEKNKMSYIKAEVLQELFASLKTSLERTLQLSEEILQETTGRQAVLEMDFMDEMAFECFLQPLIPTLDRLLGRYFLKEEQKKAKWTEVKSVIADYLHIMGN